MPRTLSLVVATVLAFVPLRGLATTYTYADVAWCDDAVPAGAQAMAGAAGEGWTWISGSPAPYSGRTAQQSILAAGLHDHSFNYASTPLAVGANDQLYAYVYLNPANPPTEVMLSWNDGSSWEHRAYWGANQISYGTSGTAGRFNAGSLPAVGQWVRLTVPASQVGLGGASIVGMGFSTFGGQADYDDAGDSVATAVSGSGQSSS